MRPSQSTFCSKHVLPLRRTCSCRQTCQATSCCWTERAWYDLPRRTHTCHCILYTLLYIKSEELPFGTAYHQLTMPIAKCYVVHLSFHSHCSSSLCNTANRTHVFYACVTHKHHTSINTRDTDKDMLELERSCNSTFVQVPFLSSTETQANVMTTTTTMPELRWTTPFA